MAITEQSESMTRSQYSALKFKHIVSKAVRKDKLIEVVYDSKKLCVDPALFNFNVRISSFTEANILNFSYLETPLFMRTKEDGSIEYTPSDKDGFIWGICERSSSSAVFNLIDGSDPTPNKEYVQWMLNLYTRILKDRSPKTYIFHVDMDENKLGGFAYLFFEDLYKLPNAITYFNKVKHSKALTPEQRDINNYRTIDSFIKMAFLSEKEVVTTDGFNPNILSWKELDQLNKNNAIIVHQDSDWIIVHTKCKEANNVFGENTVWCTAGSRYGSMFDTYNKDGKIFVLLKNKAGASAHLKTNPNNRLQFHFESDQFRNVLNDSINIAEFFNNNYGVKNYFREHILTKILKKKDKLDDIIRLLTKFGLVRDLIPILIEAKTKVLDLSGVMSKGSEFDLCEIGKIETLEELTIRDCGLTKIPEGIRLLRNLKILRLSGNAIVRIPKWINELISLEILILMRNEIEERFDVSGLTKLVELHLALNKKLSDIPSGIGCLKNMKIFDASFCNLKELPEEIMQCESLLAINVTRNRNLRKIPENLIALPKLYALTISDTGIPLNKIREMENKRINNLPTII